MVLDCHLHPACTPLIPRLYPACTPLIPRLYPAYTPLIQKQPVQLKWSSYRKVPVVLIDGDQVSDSKVIVDRIINEKREMAKREGGGKVREEEK